MSAPLPTLKETMSLAGRVIVLTGGAGQYGRTLTRQLAETGAKLVIASRGLEALKKIAAEENAAGHTVEALALDQGNEKSIKTLLEQVMSKYGRVDGLVNNAVLRPDKETREKNPEEAWRQSMQVNGTGIYLMTKHFADAMGEKGGGSIVMIGSIYGMVGPTLSFYEGTDMGVGIGDYFFIKGGMITLTKFFAGAYGKKGVRVNCVSPGGFFNNQPQLFLERYNRKNFLGRMAGHSDLGGPVAFLLSDAAAYVTGVNLPVDGGFTSM